MMTNRPDHAVLAAGLVMLCGGSHARASGPSPEVTVLEIALDAAIDPGSGTIRARAVIEIEALRDLGSTVTFFLNDGLLPTTPNASPAVEVRRLASAPWSRAIEASLPGPLARGERARIEVGYEGTLERSTSGLFRVGPRLTELSRYAVWYPWFEGKGEHPYRIDVTLPQDQRVISNGTIVEETATDGGRRTRVEGTTVARDLLLLASDSFQVIENESVIMSTVDLDPGRARSIADRMLWIDAFYADRFGWPADRAGKIPMVVLPRRGGSYARPPLLILGLWESSALATAPETEERVFHRLAHETAHLLWPLSDPDTPDDWLNEGLAEYCALQASGELFGAGRRARLVGAARQSALTEGRGRAISGALRAEPGSDAVRYHRGALIFRMLGAALEADGRSLEEVLTSYRALRSPTTSDLAGILARSSDRPLDRILDAWVSSGGTPRLWMSALRAEPADVDPEGLVLEGEVHQDPVMLEGFPLKVRASKGDRDHDAVVTLSREVTPFRVIVPFFPDRLSIDPELLILREDESFIRDLLDRALEDRVATLTAEGRLAEERGEFLKAIGIYRRAHDLSPEDVLPLYRIGRAYAQLGDSENALSHHLRARDAAGPHQELAAWNLVRIGQALETLERSEEAREAYRDALEQPDFAGAHEEAGKRLGGGRP